MREKDRMYLAVFVWKNNVLYLKTCSVQCHVCICPVSSTKTECNPRFQAECCQFQIRFFSCFFFFFVFTKAKEPSPSYHLFVARCRREGSKPFPRSLEPRETISSRIPMTRPTTIAVTLSATLCIFRKKTSGGQFFWNPYRSFESNSL